jgi:H-NS histone family
MPRAPSLSSMSVDALLKLRDDIGKVLSQKAVQLEDQLSKLGGEVGSGRRGRGSAMKGRKVPAKYRDKEGNTWAGRGAQPVWLGPRTRLRRMSFGRGLPDHPDVLSSPQVRAASQLHHLPLGPGSSEVIG